MERKNRPNTCAFIKQHVKHRKRTLKQQQSRPATWKLPVANVVHTIPEGKWLPRPTKERARDPQPATGHDQTLHKPQELSGQHPVQSQELPPSPCRTTGFAHRVRDTEPARRARPPLRPGFPPRAGLPGPTHGLQPAASIPGPARRSSPPPSGRLRLTGAALLSRGAGERGRCRCWRTGSRVKESTASRHSIGALLHAGPGARLFSSFLIHSCSTET